MCLARYVFVNKPGKIGKIHDNVDDDDDNDGIVKVQIMFMCKTHFTTVPVPTREGWRQYRGTRMFPETKVSIECRPGPNRGNGVANPEADPGYTNPPEDDKAKGPIKNSMWPGKVYSVLYQVSWMPLW